MRKAAEIASAFAPREALDGKTSFFLVGIGGAGMSALARMLKRRESWALARAQLISKGPRFCQVSLIRINIFPASVCVR